MWADIYVSACISYQCTSWAAVAILASADPGVDTSAALGAALCPGAPRGPEDWLRTGHPFIAEPVKTAATAEWGVEVTKIQVTTTERIHFCTQKSILSKNTKQTENWKSAIFFTILILIPILLTYEGASVVECSMSWFIWWKQFENSKHLLMTVKSLWFLPQKLVNSTEYISQLHVFWNWVFSRPAM